MITVRITEFVIDPEALLAMLREEVAPDAGAITSFTGVMRAEGGNANALTLQHYPGYTESEVSKIAERARSRFGLLGLVVQHRVGEMRPGETIVFVAAASAHRREAFEACDYMMDYLKSAAPFWKREDGPEGARWIEPTSRDLADRKRWED
ncbi:MAG: molybdenum cofactor biosynthesis protein MoaE [Pseudomonadota bacterium]